MNQEWFEMPEIRRRTLASSVWIPLRATNRIIESGRYGYLGYKSEYFGAGTLAVPVDKKSEAEKLGWMDVGISHNHFGCVQDEEYIPSHIYKDYGGKFTGEHLVLDQDINSIEINEWHLSQDLVTTLGLKREGDVWVRPNEGYIEVTKLHRREDGYPYQLEIRAAHLRDYLCAREMALYITSFRSRIEIVEDVAHITWTENPIIENDEMDRWEGRVSEIHKGGEPFGAKIAVFHVARTDVDPEEDVPAFEFPTDDNIESKSWTAEHHGRKLYRVEGELWRNEWIEPASTSPLVREDEIPPTVSFIIDAEGNQVDRTVLVDASRWLWFQPDVIMALAHRRGGSLSWYTKDTGRVACSPDYNVDFGVNTLGLVNVYAKDIGLLPDWQQKIWAGHNITPDGKVSEELLASQMKAKPANTQAPEAFLEEKLNLVNEVSREKLGISIFKNHDSIPKLLKIAHRFRAVDKEGLYALAKDIARLTAESIDTSAVQKIVSPPKGVKWGSLKSLENLIASKINPKHARSMLGPLVGAYELRHGDTHLPGAEIDEALKLVGVDQSLPHVHQGHQLLEACVSSIRGVADVLSRWDTEL